MDQTVAAAYQNLENKILAYNPALNRDRLRAAFEFASASHGAQLRMDGSPYILHPIAAAEITAEMGLDEDAIIACLLHDVVEDTPVPLEEISRKFGASVANIVDGVTKLTRVVYTSKEEEQMENLRKMLMAMAKDIRVILIKIADRLHNMRTMEYQSEEKRREKALETMEIYAPIAHRLGMQKIKWELEDLSLLYLDPVGYRELTCELAERAEQLGEFMDSIQTRITQRMEENGINCRVYGRIKHIYSIYRKMYTQNKQLSEVFDLCAFRVIVDNITDCYNVLGHIHDLFKPVLGRFKDYIGTPKPNMYQSLHTTVVGTEGIPFEVQIRTWEMHQTAEYGIAAHWKYKRGISGRVEDEEKFAWVRSLLEAQQDTDATEFVRELKIDMFADEVFVFTPKGDVINLPAGATPIDFAYNIHSAVGNRMIGAKVNGRIVPFETELKNGDIVEVITSGSSKGPSRDWIKIAKSSEARSKIKQWLKREKRDENIVQGRAAFEAELRRSGIQQTAVEQEDVLPLILKKMSAASLDDIYAAIGFGGITAQRVVNRIRDELMKVSKPPQEAALLEKINQQRTAQQKQVRASNGVIVEGVDNCLVKFSRCCAPVPGDDIVGFVTHGYGVSVHRADCTNYLNSRLKPEEADRWIKVYWASSDQTYQSVLMLRAKDRSGLVIDIATMLAAINAKLSALSVRETGDGMAVAQITIDVSGTDELKNAINKLSNISGVTEVRRSRQ